MQTGSGTPYRVFTPYWRLCQTRLSDIPAPAAAPDPGGPGLVLEMVYPGDPATGLPPVMVRDPVPPTGPPAADALTHERPGRNGDSVLIAAATPRLRPRES